MQRKNVIRNIFVKNNLNREGFLYRVAPFFFILLFLLIATEPLIDRVHRSFMYRHTDLPKGVIKSLHFFISDVLIMFFFMGALFFKSIAWKKFFSSVHLNLFFSFFLLTVLSVFLCPVDSNLFHYVNLFYWFLIFFLFGSIHFVFKHRNLKKFLKILFVSIFLLAIFESVVGISQYFLQGAVGLRFLGEQKLNSAHFVKSAFHMKDHTRWIFDSFLNIKSSDGEILRVYGTFPYPNVFAGFLVLSLFMSFSLHVILKTRWVKVFLCLGILMQVFTLFLTYSRAALFSFILGSIIWFFFALKKHRVKALAITVCTSILLSFSLLYPQLLTRGGIVNYNRMSEGSDQIRIQGQQMAVKLIKDYPFLGVGMGNYSLKGQDYADEFPMVHNIYLLIGSERGLLTLCSFFIFLLAILKTGFERRFDSLFLSLFCILLAYLFIGFCDFYLIFFHQGKLLFFLTAAFLSADVKTKSYSSDESMMIRSNKICPNGEI